MCIFVWHNNTVHVSDSTTISFVVFSTISGHGKTVSVNKRRRPIMTSSNGNIFRVTDHLCGEFTGPRWIPRTKASDAELWCFFFCVWINSWVNYGEAGDLRCHGIHYDVTVMPWPEITYKGLDPVWPHASFVARHSTLLTHWRRHKMADISQTTFWNAVSWMIMLEFCLGFHWSLFPRFELTIFHDWFRYWLDAEQVTSHYPKKR